MARKIVNEFHEANPGEKVNVIVTTYGDTINKLPTVVAGGIPPDISYIDAYLPKDFGVRGIAADITNYVKASTVIDAEDYYPRVVYDSTYRGHWFGLPWAPTVFTYFYNKDVFVEVGLDPDSGPSNWDELDAAIQRTLKKEGDKTERLGFWYGNSSLVWWLVPFWQQGGRLLSDDELTSTIDNETMVTAFDLTLRFFDLQGGLDAMNEFRGDERHQHLFSTGRCAMWTDVMNITRFEAYEENFAKINIGVDTYPVAEGGSPAAYRGGGAHIMPEGSNNPDGAFKFLEWLFLEPNDRRFNDGRDSLPAPPVGRYQPGIHPGRPAAHPGRARNGWRSVGGQRPGRTRHHRHSRAYGQLDLEPREDRAGSARRRQHAGAAGARRSAGKLGDRLLVYPCVQKRIALSRTCGFARACGYSLCRTIACFGSDNNTIAVNSLP